jgi:hypothetical protein
VRERGGERKRNPQPLLRISTKNSISLHSISLLWSRERAKGISASAEAAAHQFTGVAAACVPGPGRGFLAVRPEPMRLLSHGTHSPLPDARHTRPKCTGPSPHICGARAGGAWAAPWMLVPAGSIGWPSACSIASTPHARCHCHRGIHTTDSPLSSGCKGIRTPQLKRAGGAAEQAPADVHRLVGVTMREWHTAEGVASHH